MCEHEVEVEVYKGVVVPQYMRAVLPVATDKYRGKVGTFWYPCSKTGLPKKRELLIFQVGTGKKGLMYWGFDKADKIHKSYYGQWMSSLTWAEATFGPWVKQ